MKTTFIKIKEYNLYPKNQTVDHFEYVCRVLNQSIDPPTEDPHGLSIATTKKIFCSPLRRAKECIITQSGAKVLYIPQLSEVPFDLKIFCSRSEWKSQKSNAVRKYFKKAFIQDKLLFTREKLRGQIREIFRIAEQNPESTMISHTFRLTLIRVYQETNGDIFQKPELIQQYISDEKRILDFGESFDLEIS